MAVHQELARWREMRWRERRRCSLEDAAALLATHPVAGVYEHARRMLAAGTVVEEGLTDGGGTG